MTDDELLAKLHPEAIAIPQAAITPRIDATDITISSIADGMIVTTTGAGGVWAIMAALERGSHPSVGVCTEYE